MFRDPLELVDQWGPEKIVLVSDRRSGMRGVLVVDNMSRGLGKGGTRMGPTVTTHEVARLARTMTWKWAAVELFHGGAKAGILGGLPDDQLRVTGFGAEVADAAASSVDLDLRNARVAIQGFGAVGRVAAARLIELGAVVVTVSTANGSAHDPDGLDVADLCAVDPASVFAMISEKLRGNTLRILHDRRRDGSTPREAGIGLAPSRVLAAMTVRGFRPTETPTTRGAHHAA